jgi:hypothetical protein
LIRQLNDEAHRFFSFKNQWAFFLNDSSCALNWNKMAERIAKVVALADKRKS